MASVATTPETADRFFAYDLLDLTKRSIRLIHVLPNLSDEGHIQCELRHASIDTEYICLSYVWGPPDKVHNIIINGQVHTVRENMFDFLHTARRKSMRWLWIDALCIDQANNSERNHQVQQMGLIFSNAIRVVAWLGTNEHVVAFLAGMHDPHQYFPFKQVFTFNGLAYWTRAWITQEFLLARELILIAGLSERSVESLPMAVKADLIDEGIALRHASDLVLGKHVRRLDKHLGPSLINLLRLHAEKDCENVLDKVFSLLSICRDGHGIVVNYDASNQQLAFDVLRNCREGLRLCWIATVCRTLQVQSFTANAAGNGVNLVLPVRWSSDPFKPLSIRGFFAKPPHIHGQRMTNPNSPPSILLALDLVYLCREARGALFVHIRRRTRTLMYHYSYLDVTWDDPVLSDDRSSRQSWSTGFNVRISEDETNCAINFRLRLLLHLATMGSRGYPHRDYDCTVPLDPFRACSDIPDHEIK